MDFSPFLQKAQNDKGLFVILMNSYFCYIDKFCHTERSEVSKNDKFSFIFVDFLLWLAPCNPLGRYAQNDKIRHHYKITKRIFFACHCERAKRAWQSTTQRQR